MRFAKGSAKRDDLQFFNGSLRQYAAKLLAAGKGDGSVCRVCHIHPLIAKDMQSKGRALESLDVIVTQRQIFKYRNHPKSAKGANVPLDDYALVEETLCNPERIYEDTVQNRIVYICTHPYRQNRLVKVVVEPNYKSHNITINLAKSWGIVEETKMKCLQFRQIQK